MTVYAKFDGKGRFEDPENDVDVNSGEPFETTKKRFDELVAQGIPVTKVSPTEATKQTPAKGEEA